ncbi:MAG: YggS family pyridoxal phosphate-dependent enzyme [Actinobacteria bacterium]|nr:YggS family pyridoxal phosphate-dependent enzyme [Actinomycetota bacterium]
MSLDQNSVSQAVAEIRGRIDRAGGAHVDLVAVTKTFGSDAWRFARVAGCDAVGENYAQEVVAKATEVAVTDRLPVHFIGQLQTNKVKMLAGIIDVWQSVDRVSAITEIAKRSKKPLIEAFIQVNLTDEPDKGGCDPSEIGSLLQVARDSGVAITGLMTVGPTSGEPTQTRLAFRKLRTMANDFGLQQCSMGMTGDLEIAVEEGTTMVRIGSAIFGNRPSPTR